jgi:uncharacterized beta-barrel protein YwiB (DUF1934 family)
VQTAANERDTTELFTCGKLTSSKGNYTLSYQDSDVTGFGDGKVCLDVTGNDMVVMRRSAGGQVTATSLVIEKGKKHHCHYGTPYGDFMLGITADDVRCSRDGDGGELYMKYTIDVNSTLMCENEMYINFKES